MSSNGSLRYNFDWDRDWALDTSLTFQKILPIFTLLTLHPLVFYNLFRKGSSYFSEIKWAYVLNEILHTTHEINFCLLFRLHVLAPYAAIYCDGPLCRIGIPHSIQLAIIAAFAVCGIPLFQFLLFRIHLTMVSGVGDKPPFSTKVQAIVIVVEIALLILNVVSFGMLSTDSDRATQDILKNPDLAWLENRGGTIFVFQYNDDEDKVFTTVAEVIVLGCAVILIVPLAVFLSYDSIRRLMKNKRLFSSQTQRKSNRIRKTFFTQLSGMIVLYVFPLLCLIVLMTLDITVLPPFLLALSRSIPVCMFSLDPFQFSIVFILKNQTDNIIPRILAFLRCRRFEKISVSEVTAMSDGFTRNID